MDSDLIRLWGLVAELSDQLNSNRSITAALQTQADILKVFLPPSYARYVRLIDSTVGPSDSFGNGICPKAI